MEFGFYLSVVSTGKFSNHFVKDLKGFAIIETS